MLADGRRLEADVVVVGIGARPTVGWLEGSGLTVEDGVVCDGRGATGTPGIVAVGDCARWHDERRGHPHRHEHWTSATEQAAVAAATLLGAEPARGLRAPYFWSDLFDTRLQVAGWPDEADRVTIEEGSLRGAAASSRSTAATRTSSASSRSTTAGRSRAGAGRSTAPRCPLRHDASTNPRLTRRSAP